MPVPHEHDPLVSGLQGSLADAWDQRVKPRLRVDEVPRGPGSRAALSPPPGVRRSLRQPVRVHAELTIHITTMVGARQVETEPGALVLLEPNFTTPNQNASEIYLEAPWGDVRVISMVAARHRVQIYGALVEFEPVRGASLTLRDGLIVGMFRASLAGSNPPESERLSGKHSSKPGIKEKLATGLTGLFGGE